MLQHARRQFVDLPQIVGGQARCPPGKQLGPLTSSR
jgi:hypothetical protein